MSTNYYGTSIPQIKEWKERKQKSLNEASDMKGLISIIEEYYEEREPKTLHIGQSAMGWTFLFQYNGGKYYKNKLEFLNWLETLEITDEYGSSLTAGEFWSDVVMSKVVKKTRRSEDPTGAYIVIDDMEFLDCEFS